MKQHINRDDLNEITESQKQRLCKLWIPKLYDLAVANLCLDAENNKYQLLEFVIGNIIVQNHYLDVRIILCNLQAVTRDGAINVDDTSEEEASAAMEDSDVACEAADEEEPAWGTAGTPDISFFNKDECLPLLNIGQMMELLQQHRAEKSDFFVTIPGGQENYTYGSGNPWTNYQVEYEGEELCDILWECVKEIL